MDTRPPGVGLPGPTILDRPRPGQQGPADLPGPSVGDRFAVATFGVDVGGISLVALGLAFFAASFIAPETTLGPRGR